MGSRAAVAYPSLGTSRFGLARLSGMSFFLVRSEGDDIFSDFNMISDFQKAVKCIFS